MILNFAEQTGTTVLLSWYDCSSSYTTYTHYIIQTHTSHISYYIKQHTYHYMGFFEYVGDVGVVVGGGGMRHEQHQTSSKIINRLSAEH